MLSLYEGGLTVLGQITVPCIAKRLVFGSVRLPLHGFLQVSVPLVAAMCLVCCELFPPKAWS